LKFNARNWLLAAAIGMSYCKQIIDNTRKWRKQLKRPI